MRAMRMLLLAGAAMIGMGAASPPPRTAGMDTHAIAVQRFGNDAPWYQDRIPFFESARCGAAHWRSTEPDAVRCERERAARYWHHRPPPPEGQE